MAKLLWIAVISCLTGSQVAADGAGRAFPIAAENFAIDSFKRVNAFIVRNFCILINVELEGQGSALCPTTRNRNMMIS